MRVGPWGTVQVICDVFKMLTKEIITIRRSDKFLYNLCLLYTSNSHRNLQSVPVSKPPRN